MDRPRGEPSVEQGSGHETVQSGRGRGNQRESEPCIPVTDPFPGAILLGGDVTKRAAAVAHKEFELGARAKARCQLARQPVKNIPANRFLSSFVCDD